MTQAWAVVWAQWRSYRNYATKGSVAAAIIFGLFWYGIWTAAAVAAALVMAQAKQEEMIGAVSGALLLMTLYWQLIPMMMAATGMSLDLSKLKVYPIPARDLFTIEFLLRATAAMEMLLVLLGAAIGVLLNPNLPGWAALAAIPFAAFQMSLSLGLREIVTRLLNRRRMREIFSLFFILLFILPRLLAERTGAGRWLRQWLSEYGLAGSVPLWPWSAAGNLLLGENVAIASLALAAWTVFAGAFALWQFQRTLAFDPEAGRAAGDISARTNRPGFMERFYRWPATFLSDPLGALIEKESRYLARSPRFRMLFLMSCVFGLVIARGAFRETPALWAPNYLVIASLYSLLLLGEVCIWNTFGFDRAAAQNYFVAPVPFSRVLIAKNLSAALWILIQFSAVLLLSALLRFPVTLARVVESVGVTAVVLMLLLAIGNYIAVSSPRPTDPESAMRSRGAGGRQILLVLAYPLTFVPVALAYLARWALASDVAFFGMLAALAGIAFVGYRVALDSTVEYADAHKEEMVAALSAANAPIAS